LTTGHCHGRELRGHAGSGVVAPAVPACHLVSGAIAASAPIMGFPLTADGSNPPPPRYGRQPLLDTSATTTDSAWRVTTVSAQWSTHDFKYASPQTTNYCATNLLAAWPLLQMLGSQEAGLRFLSDLFRLCQPLSSTSDTGNDSSDATFHPTVQHLMHWVASPWFDLAEGSFPYPSTYIPFALLHHTYALSAWPLQAACWTHSRLHANHGVKLAGNISNVTYTIVYGEEQDDDPDLAIQVDWDQLKTPSRLDRLLASTSVTDLPTSVRDAMSIWYNISQDVVCYNVETCPLPTNNSR
jgi:hypothetical protein